MNNPNILQVFLGEWSGKGRGEFPTIEPFDYLETLSFAQMGDRCCTMNKRQNAAGRGKLIMSLHTGRVGFSAYCLTEKLNSLVRRMAAGSKG